MAKFKDPTLQKLIKSLGPDALGDPRDGRPDDHYGALLRAITGQQLSVKAAATIYARTLKFFRGKVPTPRQILKADPEALKEAAGLSRAKVGYLRSLAEHVLDGELELEKLDKLPDEVVIEELTAVKGIGVWTAHMFLMFHLERPDVLPTGDLGIRSAVKAAYGLKELPDHDTLTEIAEPWRPHRTLACRYLWASLDNEPN
ncbi:MAG: DNA-3-methyladenine glycosylase family protein [Solirubrobacterales bacterium]